MKHKPLPDSDRLRALLRYSKTTGTFSWRVSTTNRIVAGAKAGTVMNAGYVHIQIENVLYLAHRLAWRIVTGEDPGSAQIDHKNRNRSDNRWVNLRLAPNKEVDNLQNMGPRVNCSSGVPGVCWDQRKRKWRAYISTCGKQIHVGYFRNKNVAVAARKTAKRQHHTFHQVNG